MHYPVLTDMDNGYALSLNLAIWVGAEVQELMAASGRDLPRYQGNDSWMLPLPASFVVDAEGIVRGALHRSGLPQADGDRGSAPGGAGRANFTAPFHPGSFVARARSRLPISRPQVLLRTQG